MKPVDIDRALAELVGRPLDDIAPALILRSVRSLNRHELDGNEERELLDSGGVVLEVIFDMEREPGPWVWRLGVDQEDLPKPGEQLSPGEFLRGEVTWRLIEWRDTRDQQRASAAPHILRAS